MVHRNWRNNCNNFLGGRGKKGLRPSKGSKTPFTEWKFHYFSITHILREINFGDSRSSKSAISTLISALNMSFYEFLYLNGELYQINKIQSPKMCKSGRF